MPFAFVVMCPADDACEERRRCPFFHTKPGPTPVVEDMPCLRRLVPCRRGPNCEKKDNGCPFNHATPSDPRAASASASSSASASAPAPASAESADDDKDFIPTPIAKILEQQFKSLKNQAKTTVDKMNELVDAKDELVQALRSRSHAHHCHHHQSETEDIPAHLVDLIQRIRSAPAHPSHAVVADTALMHAMAHASAIDPEMIAYLLAHGYEPVANVEPKPKAKAESLIDQITAAMGSVVSIVSVPRANAHLFDATKPTAVKAKIPLEGLQLAMDNKPYGKVSVSCVRLGPALLPRMNAVAIATEDSKEVIADEPSSSSTTSTPVAAPVLPAPPISPSIDTDVQPGSFGFLEEVPCWVGPDDRMLLPDQTTPNQVLAFKLPFGSAVRYKEHLQHTLDYEPDVELPDMVQVILPAGTWIRFTHNDATNIVSVQLVVSKEFTLKIR